MTMRPHLSLPKELEKFRKDIESTMQPTIKISTSTNKPTLFASKFAGYPYLPKNFEHPIDGKGNYMKLLAQINFEDLPRVLNDMPQKGMLQIFLSGDDDVMGLDFNNQTNQKNFRVIYHEDILKEGEVTTDFSYMTTFEDEHFPIGDEVSLSFSVNFEAVSTPDRAFDEFYGELDFEEIVGEDENGDEITLLELYEENLSNEGHKIGGYAFFTQSDPREDRSYKHYDVLLLQIDTDDDNEIMWGDCGVANFFIKVEDLKKLDFSNVLYNWDCH
ncbi:YwqG family protein [Peribacillus butanolivorans]|uniref:YwqG family protein n=1 Tax=Peribacillus butanolivorans TaxID=421767 RepID=UPI003665C489